jgi:hypothetical protein
MKNIEDMNPGKIKCPICKAFRKEPIVYFAADYFVVETRDKKGHNQRYMLCSVEHRPHGIDNVGMGVAIRAGLSLFPESFIIPFGKFASIKDHWHVVMCDMKFDKEVVDITKEPRIEVIR